MPGARASRGAARTILKGGRLRRRRNKLRPPDPIQGVLTWKKQLSADYCDGTNLSEHARGTVSAPAPDRSLHAAAIIENSYDFRPATKSTQRDCKLARRYRRFSGGTQMNHLNDCLAHPYSERRRVNNHS